MSDAGRFANSYAQTAALRGTLFVVFWLILTLGNLADLPAGIVSAALATWTSLRLLPPGPSRLSPLALMHFALRFARQSIVAGVDVARRALDPRLPLRPGYVDYPCGLPQGPARNAFCVVASLLPGTLPVELDKSGKLVIHCLDTDQPVVTEMTDDERLFKRALGGARNDG